MVQTADAEKLKSKIEQFREIKGRCGTPEEAQRINILVDEALT